MLRKYKENGEKSTKRRRMSYLLLAFVLFVCEVLIALYAHDAFIRPYFGDFLVVILLYCAVKSIADLPVLPTAAGVLLFAYAIEILQFFNIAHRLGLDRYPLALVVMGSSFEWIDLVAYTAGILVVLAVEKKTGRP